MKYKVTLMQEHVVYLEADDDLEAVRQIRSMNDVEIAKAETCRGEMEIKSVERAQVWED